MIKENYYIKPIDYPLAKGDKLLIDFVKDRICKSGYEDDFIAAKKFGFDIRDFIKSEHPELLEKYDKA